MRETFGSKILKGMTSFNSKRQSSQLHLLFPQKALIIGRYIHLLLSCSISINKCLQHHWKLFTKDVVSEHTNLKIKWPPTYVAVSMRRHLPFIFFHSTTSSLYYLFDHPCNWVWMELGNTCELLMLC